MINDDLSLKTLQDYINIKRVLTFSFRYQNIVCVGDESDISIYLYQISPF